MEVLQVNYPTCGPIIFGLESPRDVNIWVRANKPTISTNIVYCILQIEDGFYIEEAEKQNDWIVLFNLIDMEKNVYKYQIGYFELPIGDIQNIYSYNWNNSYVGEITINGNNTFSFCFGSCRRYTKLMGLTLYDTGTNSDVIYSAIERQKPDFFLSIGDQVYFDPFGYISYKSLKSKCKLYRKVYNMIYHRNLYASIPIYHMCDDHDIQHNNTCKKDRLKHPETFKDGLIAYSRYQYMHGPENLPLDGNLWYTFDIEKLPGDGKCATFFVMDTRTHRNEKIGKMIEEYQMKALIDWIHDRSKIDWVKFIVSSVPFLSQNTDDSWYGYPVQQREIIDLIFQAKNVFILTGDAHCARFASYGIYSDGNKLGSITEILSSGLVAVAHDKGKSYNRYTQGQLSDELIEVYNKHNDFPYEINNEIDGRGGYQIITMYSSPSYPSPNNETTIFDKIKSLRKRIVDNVFVKIKDNGGIKLMAIIFNQNGNLLYSQSFDYEL